MTRPADHLFLAFLEGTLPEEERARFLDQLDADPAAAAELRRAAAGLAALDSLPERKQVPGPAVFRDAPSRPRRISPWWAVAASAATLAISIPASLSVGRGGPDGATGGVETGRPVGVDPSFVLVLHGRWPDLRSVDAAETRRRADEYWAWTSALADSGVLMAAGDLRWEPGERLGPSGVPMQVAAGLVEDPDYVVGMFALRVGSYEEALTLARACPHLRYGGSVSVRQVGAGFVTVPGKGDWTD